MVKIILQLYPVIPAASEEERAALRPIGRHRERYHETLLGWHDIIKAADEMGLWGAATIEHHFWSEGYEVGPNPGVLNAYWAAITKKIRVGQMGYVMSTQNPLRVAEETAILDHLANGRFFVGFARGYQSRWTNVIGQHLGTRATTSPSAAKVDPARLFGKDVRKKTLTTTTSTGASSRKKSTSWSRRGPRRVSIPTARPGRSPSLTSAASTTGRLARSG